MAGSKVDPIEVLRQAPIKRTLGEAALAELARASVVRHLGRGQMLFGEGELSHWFHLVCSGRLRVLRVSGEGTELVLTVVGPGEAIGELSVFDEEPWLRTFLPLPHGIPSHDTFGRVFALLDPQQFARCYQAWMQLLVPRAVLDGPIIAIDGKTARRSHDRWHGVAALHTITAWATEAGVALGQRKVADHENELSALPAMLEQVVVQGAVITIDAIGCQREVAATIVAKQGDYVLALKGNQPETQAVVRETFAAVTAPTPRPAPT